MKMKLEKIVDLCRKAGAAIIDVRSKKEYVDHQLKSDASPVTIADHAANEILLKGLLELDPNIPIISEESSHEHRLDSTTEWPMFWLVDPLDGTKEFISGNNEYTVNVALISNKRPVLGVVYAPALDLVYYAAEGVGCYKKLKNHDPIKLSRQEISPSPLRIAVSRSHPSKELDKLILTLKSCQLVEAGSSLKLCYVADGTADVYPRLGSTSQWDIAAGQCIVEQAGGCVVDTQGNTLIYDHKASLLNPHFFALHHKNLFSLFEPKV